LPELGHLRLTAITRARIQDLADSLVRDGKAPATVANAILPLRSIYRTSGLGCRAASSPAQGRESAVAAHD
jgi:hypothetical protein